MNRLLKRLAAPACLIALMSISSCATTENAALQKAASAQGVAEAAIILPDMPDDCKKTEPHAPVKVGNEAVSTLDRERAALARANARIGRCNGTGGFYDQVKSNLALKTRGAT